MLPAVGSGLSVEGREDLSQGGEKIVLRYEPTSIKTVQQTTLFPDQPKEVHTGHDREEKGEKPYVTTLSLTVSEHNRGAPQAPPW